MFRAGVRCRFIFPREALFGQNLVDAFAFGKIVDEFVEVAHILHERFVEGSNTDLHKVVFARIGTRLWYLGKNTSSGSK